MKAKAPGNLFCALRLEPGAGLKIGPRVNIPVLSKYCSAYQVFGCDML
jgi:hypothetical protein